MSVGQNIRAEREKLGWSREAFAEKIGKSASFIYDLEHDKSGPSLETLAAISRALNISVDTLVFGPSEKEDYSSITRHFDGMTGEQLAIVENVVRELKKAMH